MHFNFVIELAKQKKLNSLSRGIDQLRMFAVKFLEKESERI